VVTCEIKLFRRFISHVTTALCKVHCFISQENIVGMNQQR